MLLKIRGKWQRHQRLLHLVMLISICIQIPLLALSRIAPLGVFYSNQTLYYLQGMREAGVEYLQNDPDASQESTHWLFSKLVFVLQKLDILAVGSQWLEAGLVIIFALSSILVGIGIHRGWEVAGNQFVQGRLRSTEVGLASSLIFVLLINRNLFTEIEGLAAMGAPVGYLQASEFSVLVVAAIGLALLDFWWPAALGLSLAAIMHSNYMFISGILILLICFELYTRGHRRKGVAILVSFLIVCLPFFIVGPLQWARLNTGQAVFILNKLRSPHHYVVADWWDFRALVKISIMGLAVFAIIRKSDHLLRNIMIVMFLYIAFGIVAERLTGNLLVSSLLPWRASSVLLPISQIILIVAGVSLFSRRLPNNVLLFLTLLLALGANLIYKPWIWPPAEREYTTAEIALVREHTSSQDTLLVPPDFAGEFRLYVERPIFVLNKTTGYNVLDWYERILFAEAFFSQTGEYQQQACASNAFAYYLLPIDSPNSWETQFIGQTDNFLLVSCDERVLPIP